MKVSVEKLRWGIAGAVVLLVVGLLAVVSYGRWAAEKKWKAILAKNGIHISQESDNVTYSQTLQGRTVFTIRAKKAIPIANGKYTLRGVTMLLYGKNSDSVDRVEGDEFEYDEKAGIAKAIGEVHMDIEAPGALKMKQAGGQTGGATSAAASGGSEQNLEQKRDVIHVLTSGLVYLRKLGVAATDQRVEFRYEGITCVSKGAEFDTADNALHLLADVEMTGLLHGRPAVVRAARADLDRTKNTIAVLQPTASTTTRSGSESGRADNALLLLRPDGSVQHADATGGVLLENAGRRVGAQRLVAEFSTQNVPQSAVLTGGVTLDGSAAKPMHGTAADADVAFTGMGAVRKVVARGAVRLAGSVRHVGAPPLAREMRGDQVTAGFRAVGNGKETVLQEVHAAGSAMVRSEAFATGKPDANVPAGTGSSGIVSTEVSADDLLAQFAAGPSKSGKKDVAPLQHLTGQGHTRLQQEGLNGAEQVSTADSLEAAFVPETRPGLATAGARLQTAVQAGHVQIRDQASARAGSLVAKTGSSPSSKPETNQSSKRGPLSLADGDRAAFDAGTNKLTLTGRAGFQQEGTSLSAASLTIDRDSGNAEAQGNVEATLAAAARDATHVLAERARLTRANGTAEFFGTDQHPARMWQAGSQVMAADLFLDNGKQSLSARPAVEGGMVEAVFAGQGQGGAKTTPDKGKKGSESAGEAAHVMCPRLNYSGLRHEAVCSGRVTLRQGDMQARAQQAVVFLASAPPQVRAESAGGAAAGLSGAGDLGGTLERMVLSGSVRLDEPGRAGDGEQLVYTAKEGTYLLTGTAAKPARVADAEQGMVTGPALLLRSGEKSVIVTGTAASNGHDGMRGSDGRVHTEVTVRPQEQ